MFPRSTTCFPRFLHLDLTDAVHVAWPGNCAVQHGCRTTWKTLADILRTTLSSSLVERDSGICRNPGFLFYLTVALLWVMFHCYTHWNTLKIVFSLYSR